MSEADILAHTYSDSCNVYRPFKDVKDNGESVFKTDLEGRLVHENMPCALSSLSGGKLQQSISTASAPADYLLFVRPEVSIEPNDTVVVRRFSEKITLVAGRAKRHVSHNSIEVKLKKEKV